MDFDELCLARLPELLRQHQQKDELLSSSSSSSSQQPRLLPLSSIADLMGANSNKNGVVVVGGGGERVLSYNKNDNDAADHRNATKESGGIVKLTIPFLDKSRIRLRSLANRNDDTRFTLEQNETYCREEYLNEMKRFNPKMLNDDQKAVYDFICDNTDKIVLIQAGPGCGKSFVLKSIAYHMTNVRFDTIIYKHDLLAAFMYNSRRHTVAKFVMKALHMNYKAYQAFDKLLSSRLSAYQFMLVIIAMLRKMELGNFAGGIIFLDEYTIVAKPILLVMLILFEHYRIGTVICGDRNQLQNIFNSCHAATMSSFRLGMSFATCQFSLRKNERCSDERYNKIVEFFAQFSSSKRLDRYAFALIAACFLRQLIEPPTYHQIHLAGTHQELTDLAHMLVCNKEYSVDFYGIDKNRLRSTNDANMANNRQPTLQQPRTLVEYLRRVAEKKPPYVGKFLPYLPLVEGGRYYVNRHSEYSQGILKSIDGNHLTLLMDNGTMCTVTRNVRHEVLFEQHREFLLDGERGRIFSFPIYPANFMTIHKCQGCTITENLDLLLTNTKYQGLYVALSRVTRAEQIARISIPDQISHIVSSIINFPQHIDHNRQITVEELQSGMVNYIFYDVSARPIDFANLAASFELCQNASERRVIRDIIIEQARVHPQSIVRCDQPVVEDANNVLAMNQIIRYRDLFLALSCLDEFDRNVWLHEFMLINDDMRQLLPTNFKANSSKYQIGLSEQHDLNELIKLAGLNNCYSMTMSSMDYIRENSRSMIRMNREDREAHAKFVIERSDDYVSLESTEFCAKVYAKLKTPQSPITEQWLFEQLNDMLLQFNNCSTSHPEKKTNTDQRAVCSAASSKAKVEFANALMNNRSSKKASSSSVTNANDSGRLSVALYQKRKTAQPISPVPERKRRKEFNNDL